METIENYQGVVEKIYKIDHPEVIKWTNYFKEKAEIDSIFYNFNQTNGDCVEHAKIVGRFWYEFSKLAPKVLCICAGKVNCNLIRHYIIQTAFEELGERNHKAIHPELFKDSLRRIEALELNSDPIASLNALELDTIDLLSESEILGFLLGMELPAEENIESVFAGLSYGQEMSELLAKTPFFRIHRVVEIEHIRLNVANFLRFCKTNEQKTEFIKGFDTAINFWKSFWKEVSETQNELELAYS